MNERVSLPTGMSTGERRDHIATCHEGEGPCGSQLWLLAQWGLLCAAHTVVPRTRHMGLITHGLLQPVQHRSGATKLDMCSAMSRVDLEARLSYGQESAAVASMCGLPLQTRLYCLDSSWSSKNSGLDAGGTQLCRKREPLLALSSIN